MNIAIDCRYLGKSGIGRVCQGILENLDYSLNKFYLVGKKALLNKYTDAVIVENDTDPFSVKGLFRFSNEVNKTCDAIIVPNFIIPYGIKIPVLSIMHDLIFLDLKKTNKNFIDAMIKKHLLKRCVKKSSAVSCVSGFTKSRCEHYYPKFSDKYFVNYNGLSQNIIDYVKEGEQKDEKSIVFVGNVKPHKGLKTLIEAFNVLPVGYQLKIIGEKDNFLTGYNDKILESEGVVFTGRISDEELFKEIVSAGVLVQPSEYEGFGIPPLEAMYLGTKPIISDIKVFKEIYEGLPVDFFKVGNAEDLADKILVADHSINDVKSQITGRYNYKKCADSLISRLSLFLK